jgi:hypoxanthine phosphoribosyltransferase
MKKSHIFKTYEEISRRIEELANEISKDCCGNKITSVTVLEGGRKFSNELRSKIKNNKIEVENYEVKISSYDSGKNSSGIVKLIKPILEDLSGKDILILEDLVDTGNSMNYLMDYLKQEKKVRSIKIACLLDKPSRRVKEVNINYLGFTIPDKFIIGYGMDWDGKFRELDYLALLPKN